jgi:hypothetical protein
MTYLLFKTSQLIRGWFNYFGITNRYQLDSSQMPIAMVGRG